MKEEWKDVVGFEGVYEISSNGQLRRVSTQRILSGGGLIYRQASLSTNGVQKSMYIHKMVTEAFIGPAFKMQVNHIDKDKRNNNVLNLEYVTARENMCHTHGRTKMTGVQKRGRNYRALAYLGGKTRHLGTYKTKEEANAAYNKACGENKYSTGR